MSKNHNVQLVHEDTRITSAWGKLMRIVSDAFADDTVNTPSDLTPALVPNGTMKYVEDLKCTFIYDQTSTLAPDGITIIDSDFNGNWLRQDPAPDAWGKQATWYIDPVAGIDTNPGTLALPLKTLAEWYRRTGGIVDDIVVNVYLVGNIPATDPLPARIGWKNSGNLIIQGTRTAVATGTLTGYTPANFAGNTGYQISAVIDWAPHVGRLVYDTEQQAWFRIAKDLTGGNAIITRPFKYSVDDNRPSFTAATPQNGDTFTVYTLSTLYAYNGIIDVGDPRSMNSEDYRNNLVIKDVYLAEEVAGFASINIKSPNDTIFFNRVNFGYTSIEGSVYCALCLTGADTVKPWFGCKNTSLSYYRYHLQLMGYFASTSASSDLIALRDFISVGGYIAASDESTLATYDSLGIFDAPSPLRVGDGCVFISYDSYVYGSGNSGICVVIGAQARFCSTNFSRITITGTGTELLLGGDANILPNLLLSATLPLPALVPLTTWANLATLSNEAYNVSNGAYIGPIVVDP
jgi:hypothetical protein